MLHFSLITFNQEDEIFPKVTRTASRIKSFINNWENITSDPEIFNYVRDCKIENSS